MKFLIFYVLQMKYLIHALCLLITGVIYAEKKGAVLHPTSGYPIHDQERPHPKKVTNTKTLQVQPPSDAIILFNGGSMEAWKGNWEVKNGVLIASKGNLESKQHFGKAQIHLEYRVPAGREVKGQKGGNSGVFLMGLYEIQVQESHTNVTYADGQAGAMYGDYPPLVNPSTAQGEWQSYDIIFEPAVIVEGKVQSPARVTVLHNGVLIHHAQPFTGVSTHKRIPVYPESLPEKGPIKLQWHQDPIEFRNIWVRELGEYSHK